jgi:hypothetical protein
MWQRDGKASAIYYGPSHYMVMDATGRRLEAEARKWLERLEKKRGSVRALADAKGAKPAMENMDAYIRDCRHWLSKGDFVLAFEAVVYAWGILETLERTGFVEAGGR